VKTYTTYTQGVKDLKSAQEFCKLNAITPKIIVVVWEEEE